MHIPPLLPVSMTMLALSGAAFSLPLPATPQEGSSLDVLMSPRAEENSSLRARERSPSPPPMIRIIDPAGEVQEVVETGPVRTRRKSRSKSSKPYDGASRKGRSKVRDEDPVKQADKLALDLAGLKLNSRTSRSM